MKPAGGKIWFTAAELAALSLPGLPKSKRKINEDHAPSWLFETSPAGQPLAQPRQARGGGMEFHIDVLPASARAELARRGVAIVADVTDAPETRTTQLWRWYEGCNAKTKAEAIRRAGIIAQVDAFEQQGMTRSAAVASTAAANEVGPSTLWSWIGLLDGVDPSDRLPYLAPRRGGGGSEAAVAPEAWQFIKSDYLRPEQPTFSDCYRRLIAFAVPLGIDVPCERTLRRKLEREVDSRLIVAKRAGAEALRRTLPPQQRSVLDLHAMEAVNIDGHKFDVFVQWPDGRIGRPLMVAVQDLYSRKFLAWRIDESESALSTRLVFADLFRDWGIPKMCVLDNGRAFASKTITGGAKTRFRFKIKDEDPTGVLPALGIQVKWAMPYRGQSKPIERGFRDFCQSIAKHPRFAGAYTGNRPDAKPENYGSKAIPLDVFKRYVDAGIAEHNRREGRRTEIAQGRSFDATFAESYAVSPIGKATPEQLRLALLTAEERRCDRQSGTITLDGNRYWTPELADHAGKMVTVRFDPDNLHGEVFAYDREGRLIAAVPVIEKSGFFDRAAANKRRSQESELRRLVRDAEKAEDLLAVADLAALLPDYEDENARPQPSVIQPVRHRGQTAAALKPVSEAHEMPLNPVLDRLGKLQLVK